MFWHGMPPELNTARLMAGAGPAPMLQAAAGWEALAIFLETQADELAASLAALSSAWSGSASESAVAATMPMVVWLRTVSAQAQKRALQATAQANSYSVAMVTTPPIPEIEQNHITNAVLNSTNFLGINTVPIAVNEFDYFVRMWNQAAGAMDLYQAETGLNMLFEPIMPMTPIVIPGVGEGRPAPRLVRPPPWRPQPRSATRRSHTSARRRQSSRCGLQTGRVGSQANQMAVHARGPGSADPEHAAVRSAGPDAAGRTARHADGYADGVPAGFDARSAAAAGRSDDHPADAAADPATAAGDVDVQPDGRTGQRQRRSDGADRGQPAVQPPVGRRIRARAPARAWCARRRCPARADRGADPADGQLIGATEPVAVAPGAAAARRRRAGAGRRRRRWGPMGGWASAERAAARNRG